MYRNLWDVRIYSTAGKHYTDPQSLFLAAKHSVKNLEQENDNFLPWVIIS